MNSIDSNIQLKYEIERKNGVLLYLICFFPAPMKASQHLSIVKLCCFLPPYSRSCKRLDKIMVPFNTFVKSVLNICSDRVSFNSEIQELKSIALDRGYNHSIIDKAHLNYKTIVSHTFLILFRTLMS